MRNPRAKKPFSSLAERLKEIRKRRPSKEQIEEMNRIFEEIDQEQQREEEKQRRDKIARSPEAGA